MTAPAAATGPAPGPGRCPRCGGTFHCGRHDPGPCPCSTVVLDAATLAALRSHFRGCLCMGCLAALAGGARPQADEPRA